MRVEHRNPYRQPKPVPNDAIVSGKFYLANDRGSYGARTSPVHLTLCRDYLWVSETLSIPLTAITATGLSKHGGYICFVDAVANTEVRFNFTKIGFLRFRRKDVESFLSILNENLPSQDQIVEQEVASTLLADVSHCERCGQTGVNVFTFKRFRFVGIAPIAYAYRLTPLRYVLCPQHARQQVIRDCLHTAATGYLGFPGFIAAPWYVFTNVWCLWRQGAANIWTAVACGLTCIILPLTVLGVAVLLLTRLKLG